MALRSRTLIPMKTKIKTMMEKNKTIQRTLQNSNDIRVRESDVDGEQSRTITGYAILFNTPSAPLWSDEESEAREVIAPGAITRELLDKQDIKFTMFHDRQLILARSNNGAGTLTYNVDEKGVSFEFDAPDTVDGDKALELVRRGDIAGCSFAFTTMYYDPAYVTRSATTDADGVAHVTYTVNVVTGVYDFTLAADPAYPDTSVESRSFADSLRMPEPAPPEEPKADTGKMDEQVREMRAAASHSVKLL